MLSRGKDAGLLLLTAVLSLLMLGMGGWQLSRAEEKRQLLAEWQQRRNSDISLAQASAMVIPFGYRLTTHGRYLAGKEVWLDNQIQAGRVGYRLIRALPTAQGLLMVDTGWQPADADRRQLPAIAAITPPIPLSGHLIRPYQAPISLGQFTFIPSHPLVPSLAPALLTQIWGEPVLPFVLKLSAEHEQWQPVVMGPERHLGYAVQWFLMALAVCIAAFWYYRRPHE
ncbi:hypothetical protein CBP31_06535 [Oceanisphaera profunda]|uniref:SURF1-like protein n=1 Tax=Oceanisphaera profunda TaxID=1416627 RepID=A0A1Y0D523_9GAMM|nr:SURF1 family protein [Oceanisphaera profunda]ART82317.1 hypothetical protein CBP31_06535 [Oceanisphaera profunda]